MGEIRQQVRSIVQDESVDGEDMLDDEGFQDERENWEVTHVCEEDLETTEGEGVDFLAELLEMTGWSQVNDEETEKELS
jgi:hypothetical protein